MYLENGNSIQYDNCFRPDRKKNQSPDPNNVTPSFSETPFPPQKDPVRDGVKTQNNDRKNMLFTDIIDKSTDRIHIL